VKLLAALGTRPEIVKLAPVVHAVRAAGIDVRLVATGQHHDQEMAGAFFERFDLSPDECWELEGDEAHRVATILERAFAEVERQRPDALLLLGDTYTVPLLCLAARRHRVPVIHLEAGLRSFNPLSMEEVNRRTAGALASLHLAPTSLAASFLHREGVAPERVRVVGNPIIDVLTAAGRRPRPVEHRAGVLVTAHRATNVDDPSRLADLVTLVERLAIEIGPVVFPVHPRTHGRLEAAGLLNRFDDLPVQLLPPIGWDAMLTQLSEVALVVTDSGGLQEEASYFGVPVVVLRRSTPRWEGIQAGTSVLVGTDVDLALHAAHRLTEPDEQERIAAVPCPYGDGTTGIRVAELLAEPETSCLLTLEEPEIGAVGPRLLEAG
jgi:UDP-N-acetylglucosamine 2-epimerase (non-hydrolysing)